MMILAPLRGVTIRAFRRTFASAIQQAGFAEAITPFVPALSGLDPMKDRELRPCPESVEPVRVTPQFIGKDPMALRVCLERIRAAGYETADLNCGCPFPMVRNKGRGSGLLKTPDVLEELVAVGCETMGPGKFSVKARLGIDTPDLLLSIVPRLNAYPLRFLTVHARTARQMYEGACDWEAVRKIESIARIPLVRNGDLDWRAGEGMVGRSFVRDLGRRRDIRELLIRYAEISRAELYGDRPVLGRLKELLAYFRELPNWQRKWDSLKICRSTDELFATI